MTTITIVQSHPGWDLVIPRFDAGSQEVTIMLDPIIAWAVEYDHTPGLRSTYHCEPITETQYESCPFTGVLRRPDGVFVDRGDEAYLSLPQVLRKMDKLYNVDQS
jgi:hypothetical protein